MEEAIVDVALDLNLLPAERLPLEKAAQQDMRTDHRDQAQLLATVPHAAQAAPTTIEHSQDRQQEACHARLQNRAARVEILRQRVANGSYHIDNADLAECILRNSTRFVETC